jgi:hypothetical protein
MTARAKRRRRQKWRVLQAQEYLIGLSPYAFAALLTALDDLDELNAEDDLVPWGEELPRETTTWEKIKEFLFGSKDAESN